MSIQVRYPKENPKPGDTFEFGGHKVQYIAETAFTVMVQQNGYDGVRERDDFYEWVKRDDVKIIAVAA